MRATLPHLRLFTLPTTDPISLLAKFLTAEEKTYLAGRLLFKDENTSDPAPPSLDTSTVPREPAKVSLASRSVKMELIPEDSIITDHFKMPGQLLHMGHWLGDRKDVFSVEFSDVSHNVCLTGMEILTRGNNQPKICRGTGSNSER